MLIGTAGLWTVVGLLGSGAEPAGRSPAASVLEESGFEVVTQDVGVTGRRSSYHGRDMADEVFASLPEISGKRVAFAGSRPASGSVYDEGVLAWRLEGDKLVIAVAAGIDPRNWHRGSGGELVGQGDAFLAVQQGDAVEHFALLNSMNLGKALGHGGYWDDAQSFRYEDEGAVGQVVWVRGEEDVVTAGGDEGHPRHGKSPRGLDERVFARGGDKIGVGEVQHYAYKAWQPLDREDARWFVTEWTVPLSALGDETRPMTIHVHVAPSCGNDQIEGRIEVEGQDKKKRRRPLG